MVNDCLLKLSVYQKYKPPPGINPGRGFFPEGQVIPALNHYGLIVAEYSKNTQQTEKHIIDSNIERDRCGDIVSDAAMNDLAGFE